MRDLQTTALDAADDRGAAAAHLRSAHVHRDGAIGLHPDLPGPGPRLHLQRRALGQPMAEQVAGEHPDAVAAHLRDAAVGVAVVHEPAARAGADRPQDPVRAEPEAPVAEPGDQFSGERQGTFRIGQDQEVVPGAVALGESHDPIVARARPSRSGPPAGSQLIRGSRRNHDSWRRANLRVARTVSAAACSCDHSPARYRSTCAYPSARLAVRPSRSPAPGQPADLLDEARPARSG